MCIALKAGFLIPFVLFFKQFGQDLVLCLPAIIYSVKECVVVFLLCT